MDALIADLARQENVRIELDYRLSAHSTFRIGGCAKLAILPQSVDALTSVLQMLSARGVRSRLVGNASNIVFPDGILDDVLVVTTHCKKSTVRENTVTVASGVTLAALAQTACKHGLSGLEFAHGIPGTVGGALVMNAGAFGGSMEDVCAYSEYFDPESGKIKRIEGAAHRFGYRTSLYQSHPEYAILSAKLLLKKDDPAVIAARMEEYKQKRHATQPLGLPSAGSVFKRPEGHFAGKLIEDCGLKGFTIGGAQVSEKHAGFIVNCGGATAEDVRRLVEHIRKTVLREYGVELECEIQFW